MSERLLSYETESGEPVVFAVDVSDDDFELVQRGRNDPLVSEQRLDQALDSLQVATTAVFDNLDQMVRRPDEFQVEFGIRMNAKVGAIIASSEAQGHIKVTLKWRRDDRDR